MLPFTAEGGVTDMLHVVIKTKSLPQTWCMQSDPVDHDVLTPMSRDLKLPLVGPWRPACRIQITPIKNSDDVALFLGRPDYGFVFGELQSGVVISDVRN